MDVKTLDQPIFMVGAGRSGSTIFHEIFCRHPQVAWISKLCDVFPKQAGLNNLLLESLDTALVGQMLQNLIIQPKLIKPSEAYRFWEYHCSGFTRPCRDLNAEDVTHQNRQAIQKALANLLTTQRQRLLVKITGWSRMGFLEEIFEDAKFIHVVRDGRAVVNSILQVDWWEGWQGPQSARGGGLLPCQLEQWERSDRSFVALAAIEFNILMDAMQTAKSTIKPENFLEIRYEDLCENPVDIFKQTIDFCELKWQPEFEQSIQEFNLRNTNYKWQKDLTPKQQKNLETLLTPYLKLYGYLPLPSPIKVMTKVEDPKLNFCILATQRSGSTWLVSLLESHPSIKAFSELFIGETFAHPADEYLPWSDEFLSLFYEFQKANPGIRLSQVFQYLETLSRYPSSHRAIGFKLMYSQLAKRPEILLKLILGRYRVINLVRENPLDIVISKANMRRTGSPHFKQEQALQAIELSPALLLKELKKQDTKTQLMRTLLNFLPLEVLNISYESLCENRSMVIASILNFLEVEDSKIDLNSELKKISKGQYSQKIANFEEVKATLTGTKFQQFLQE